MTQIYSKIYNMKILQDFVNVNIKWLCFSNYDDVKKKNDWWVCITQRCLNEI